MTPRDILVTGGAGFIGSHLVDALMTTGAHVTVFDDLSSGKRENITRWLPKHRFTFLQGDLLNPRDLAKIVHTDYDIIFHLAANPEVRISATHPDTHVKQNVYATHHLLEALRTHGSQATFVFASTSTVYGDAARTPTPEDYGPLTPISVYGATKLACEALITAYAHTYHFPAVIYRLANVVGPRNHRNVVHDFIAKLTKTPTHLEILGDGTQVKSYIHIDDCIHGMLIGVTSSHHVDTFNIGSDDQITVNEIAQLVIDEMCLEHVKLTYTGGVDGGRGWQGDVKNMLLDTTKLKALGWTPKSDSAKAIQTSVHSLLGAIKEPSKRASM